MKPPHIPDMRYCPLCQTPIPAEHQGVVNKTRTPGRVQILFGWWCIGCLTWWVKKVSFPAKTFGEIHMGPLKEADEVQARLAENAIFTRRGFGTPMEGT